MWDFLQIRHSRYTPWAIDNEFLPIYKQIINHTLVDEYRCYELWQLVKHCSKLQVGCLLEVGVWRGGTGVLIAKCAEKYNIVDKTYLCDGFFGVVKSTEKDVSYKGGEHADTNEDIVKDLIAKTSAINVEIHKGIFPDDTGHIVSDQKIRFCHIDVDTYQSAKDVYNYIWDKMVVGGIVVYDDYGFQACCGVTKHVNEMIADKDKLIIYNINGHAIMVKLS